VNNFWVGARFFGSTAHRTQLLNSPRDRQVRPAQFGEPAIAAGVDEQDYAYLELSLRHGAGMLVGFLERKRGPVGVAGEPNSGGVSERLAGREAP